MNLIRFYLDDLTRLVESLPGDTLEGWYRELRSAYEEGRQVFLLGNGGSASTCSHIVNDLQKCIYLASGRTFKVMSLTDNMALVMAWANDTSYERIFAEQLRPWVEPGDLVFCVSGSGNSPNVLAAAELAREAGARVLGLTGYQGGRLAPLCDESIVVPSDNMQRIEDCHMVVLHLIFWRLLQDLERAGGEASP